MFGYTSIVLVGLVIFVAFLAFKQVPQGFEWTVERFGRYTQILRPGLHFIIPFVDRIGFKLNVMEQVLGIPTQEVISKDNAMVSVDGVVFFQVIDTAKASYEINNLEFAIRNLIVTNIRTVLGSLDLDEMLSRRDVINTKLLSVVDDAATSWGVKVNRIEIKDITPPMDLVNAMAAQMKAEREKRARILEAEGIKQAAILKSEGEKRSRVLSAEADREAAFLASEAREREAQAEAKATEMVSTAIAKGDSKAINYFVAQKYIESFSKLAESNNSKLVMVPWEANSVLGSLAGITELFKDLKK
ncbi:MAG: SPFH domain-containing protein [Gammaproteobacteria bacterium]